MKLRKLHLAAFGPFTDTTLDFSANGNALHIIYGSNEAGKSSALRALTNLFYGIPARTNDNFIHPNTKLRIGASLEGTSGDMLDIFRRKGTKGTLLDADGSPLDESRLSALLSGVSQSTFEALFGISHKTLSEGGDDILKSGGNLGESLFAAGGGIAHLREVQSRLQDEQDKLFKKTGSRPRINAGITNFSDAIKQRNEAATRPEEYEELRNARDAEDEKRQQVQNTLDAVTKRISELERYQSARPLIMRREARETELKEVQDAPRLPEDFSERRHIALATMKSAEEAEKQASASAQKISNELAALDIPDTLLHAAIRVDALTEQAGAHRKAQQDRPAIQQDLATLKAQAQKLLANLRPDLSLDNAEVLRIGRQERETLRECGHNLTLASDHAAKAESVAKQARAALVAEQESAGALPAVPDILSVKSALEQAQSHGDLEQRFREANTKLQTEKAKADDALARLPLFNGALGELSRLPVPPEESVRQTDKRMQDLQSALDDINKDILRVTHDRLRHQQTLDGLLAAGNIPTAEDLTTARTDRDTTWSGIRAAWCDGDESILQKFSTKPALADAFEQSIQNADRISDDMFREAERVTSCESARRNIARLDSELRALAERQSAANAALADAKAEWQTLWQASGITPLEPAGMLEWLSARRELLALCETIRQQEKAVEAITRAGSDSAREIVTSLREAGTPIDAEMKLQTAKTRAEAFIEEAETLRRRHSDAQKAIQRLTQDVRSSESALEDAKSHHKTAQKAWKDALAPLGLQFIPTVKQADAILDDLTELFGHIDSIAAKSQQLAAIDRDYAQYAEEVKHLVNELAPDLSELSALDAAARLGERLAKARMDSEKHDMLTSQLKDKEREQAASHVRFTEASATLDTMCAEAGVDSPGDLAAAEERSRKRQQAEADIRSIDDQLRTFRADSEADAFAKTALSLDPDDITAELSKLKSEQGGLDETRSALEREIGSLSAKLEAMDGTSEAARYAEEAEQHRAGIETDVSRYIRLKLASAVLTNAIERYRKAHQNPILSRAEEIFCKLTLGSFTGLRQDMADDGTPVIVGIRGEDRVRVESMSDGTRDQLYLSLRIAALERYMEKNPPLPFVVDDILVHFDDDRSAATLSVLADLATRTQVIFFTHNAHLCEIARKAVPAERLYELSLDH